MGIDRHNLVEQFRTAFPELEQGYQALVRKAQGEYVPSNYQVIGQVLQPRLKEELVRGEVTDLVRRSADFMERVCASTDDEAENVIWIEIFEWLIFSEPQYLSTIWPALGERTKSAINDAKQRWHKALSRLGRT